MDTTGEIQFRYKVKLFIDWKEDSDQQNPVKQS